MQGLWVQSLVGKLRSHMLCNVAKKKFKKVRHVYSFLLGKRAES